SLNFCVSRKKQTTLPSLAYAGIPYQSFGESSGALARMIAWSRSPVTRSGSGIAAIFARTALSPSASSARGPGRAAAFLAARPAVRLADFCAPFAWASLPGPSFSDIGVSYPVVLRGANDPAHLPRGLWGATTLGTAPCPRGLPQRLD